MLPNGLQYTRQWMNKIIGEQMVQTMFEFANKFNALRLTHEEHALVFPVVICVKGNAIFQPVNVPKTKISHLTLVVDITR